LIGARKLLRSLYLTYKARWFKDADSAKRAIAIITDEENWTGEPEEQSVRELADGLVAVNYHQITRLTNDVEWLDLSIDYYLRAAQGIKFDQRPRIWAEILDGLSSTFGKRAILTTDAVRRAHLLKQAIAFSDELSLKLGFLSKNLLKNYYNNRNMIYLAMLDFAAVAELQTRMLKDERLKLSTYERFECQLESVRCLVLAHAQAPKKNSLISALSMHELSQKNQFVGLSRKKRFNLLNLRARNSVFIHTQLARNKYLNQAEASLKEALFVSRGSFFRSKNEITRTKISSYRIRALQARSKNDRDIIDSVVRGLGKVLSDKNPKISPDVVDFGKAVLCQAFLQRSIIIGESELDAIDAFSLFEELNRKDVTLPDSLASDIDQLVERSAFKHLFGEPRLVKKTHPLKVRKNGRNRFRLFPISILKMLVNTIERAQNDQPNAHFVLRESDIVDIVAYVEELLLSYLIDTDLFKHSRFEDLGTKALKTSMFSILWPKIRSFVQSDLHKCMEHTKETSFHVRYTLWKKNGGGIALNSIKHPTLVPIEIIQLSSYLELLFEDEKLQSLFATPLLGAGHEFFRIFHQEKLLRKLADLQRRQDERSVALSLVSICLAFEREWKGSIQDYFLHDIRSLHGRCLVRIGDIDRDLNPVLNALEKLQECGSQICIDTEFKSWFGNRESLLKGIGVASNLDPALENQISYIDSVAEVLDQLKFDCHPVLWCDWQIDLCRMTLRALMEFGLHQLHQCAIDRLEQYFEHVEVLIGASSNQYVRNKNIHAAAELGDMLSYLYEESASVDRALSAIDATRGIRLSSSFAEAELPAEFRDNVRRTRLDWEAKTDLNATTFGQPTELTGGIFKTKGEVVHSSEEARKAFVRYCEALAASGARKEQIIDPEKLTRSIPRDALLCIPVLTDYGCKMIVVGRDKNGGSVVKSFPLPDLKKSHFDDLLRGEGGWLATYREFRDTDIQDNSALNKKFYLCEERLTEISLFLGEMLIQPLVNMLVRTGLSETVNELMIIPNGAMSMLSLQSAKYNNPDHGDKEEYLIERFAVSLWPTLSSVMRSSKPVSVQPADKSLLVIDALAENEANVPSYIATLKAEKVTIFGGVQSPIPDSSEIMTIFASHRYSYLYCHGYWNNNTPDESGLSLNNAVDDYVMRINVKDIRRAKLTRNRLMFLGACESSMIGVDFQPNEFIGLPASFFEAGVRGVISTQWMVHKEYCTKVANVFFESHLAKNKRPAIALQEAILKVSNVTNNCEDNEFSELMLWAPFVIYGS